MAAQQQERIPRHSRASEPEPGDELGTYSLEELLRMDAEFSNRLERAFAAGKESRASAYATVTLRSRQVVVSDHS
jgi:hypothetical protein